MYYNGEILSQGMLMFHHLYSATEINQMILAHVESSLHLGSIPCNQLLGHGEGLHPDCLSGRVATHPVSSPQCERGA